MNSATVEDGRCPTPTTVILCGAVVHPRADRLEPRVDVVVMRDRWNAKLHAYAPRPKGGRRGRGQPWLPAAKLVWRARRDIAAADRIYATGEDVAMFLGWHMRLTRNRRANLITRFENPDVGRTKVRAAAVTWALRTSLPRADRILCRTQVQVDAVKALLRDTSDRVIAVGEPVDRQFFTPPETAARRPMILTGGAEMRDYDTFLQAVADLEVDVVVAVGSPWALATPRVGDTGALSHITITSLTRGEMREHYQAASVVVVPLVENRRSCGLSVVNEALACGAPVIVSDTEGLKTAFDADEVVKVAVGNSEALRDAIRYVLSASGGESARVAGAAYNSLDEFVDTIELLWSAR